ncbi:FHA domain-containing protein [Simiduia agarivorans]|uniref:FHA domain-containing protein n=1 Tax=Simiduia agarivorans (strain DSM 21679 / JCM 13881 / BCRC 17597 / SA1) TaxID=1117647 RepID=K4KKQ4_SIMAS|nr:FHA domain-containing protein [Simiduia agarivorans]AFU98623.1 FHA domain-containing protein [Simiduia agarivorans SA1 = DSM 21679]
MYKIHVQGDQQPPHWISDKNLVLGSAPDCGLQLPGAEPHHARLIAQNNRLILKDNRSQGGSFVNGQRATEREVFPGDLVRLGETSFRIMGPSDSLEPSTTKRAHIDSRWSLVSDSSWLAGQEFVIAPGVSAIGRATQCEIVIPGTHLSRQHAEFELSNGQLRIRDLGSSNGTFVNEERLTANQPLRLVPGDRLRFDVYTFQVVGPGMTTGSTRLRDTLSESGNREKKPLADSKMWKTKPTSPGNRIEPAPKNYSWLKAGLILVILVVAAGLYIRSIL